MKSFARHLPKTLVAASLLCFAASSMAQWQWRDATGRMVYSDRPPPGNIPAKNIVKQPGGMVPVVPVSNTATRSVNAKEAAAAASQAASAASQPAPAADPKAAAEAKKKADEEAAKQKAEDERVAKGKAENCQRARTALATLRTGMRVSTTNAKGEPIVMDDKARAAEEKRLNDIAAADCS